MIIRVSGKDPPDCKNQSILNIRSHTQKFIASKIWRLIAFDN